MSVFLLCEQAIGLVRGKRLILSGTERTMLEALNYEGLASANAQDEAVVCALHFSNVRDSLLQMYPWIFARRTETPAQLSESVAGWRYSFQLPSDCLKVLAVIADNKRLSYYKNSDYDLSVPPELVELLEHEETGEHLYSNRTPVHVRYTARITDDAKWAAAFKEVFIAKLAEAIALAVGVDKNTIQLLDNMVQNIIQSAVQNGLIKEETGLPRQHETQAFPRINNLWLDYSGIRGGEYL